MKENETTEERSIYDVFEERNTLDSITMKDAIFALSLVGDRKQSLRSYYCFLVGTCVLGNGMVTLDQAIRGARPLISSPNQLFCCMKLFALSGLISKVDVEKHYLVMDLEQAKTFKEGRCTFELVKRPEAREKFESWMRDAVHLPAEVEALYFPPFLAAVTATKESTPVVPSSRLHPSG